MEVKRKGRRPTNSRAFEKIRQAGRKEVVISRREWKLVVPPGAHILRKYLKAEYTVRSLVGDKGWVVKKA